MLVIVHLNVTHNMLGKRLRIVGLNNAAFTLPSPSVCTPDGFLPSYIFHLLFLLHYNLGTTSIYRFSIALVLEIERY